MLIATGGDDNAISVSHLKVTCQSDQLNFTVMNKCKHTQAHAAQVTG